MKQLLILITFFTFVSCSNSSNPISNPESKNMKGTVAITFQKTKARARAQAALVSSQSSAKYFPDPTNVRVVIRRIGKYDALADVKVPTDTTVLIKVPAKNNYRIDAFSYIDSKKYLKSVLKVGQKKNISVTADEVTKVELKLKPVSHTFTIPDTVVKGKKFEIKADYNGFLNVSAKYGSQAIAYLKLDSLYHNSINNNHPDNYDTDTDANGLKFEWTGLSINNFENRYVYFQINTYIGADAFYKVNENKYSFVLNYPNPYVSDTLKTFVKTPKGSIGIGIQY
jgi:hypothetical protein